MSRRRPDRTPHRLNKTELAILEALAEDPTLSQVRIAKIVGVKRQTVGEYMRGSLADPIRRMTRAVVEDSIRRARSTAPQALTVLQSLMAGKDPSTGQVPTMTIVTKKGEAIEIEAQIFPSTRLKAATKIWDIAQERIAVEPGGCELPEDLELDQEQLERVARAFLKVQAAEPGKTQENPGSPGKTQQDQAGPAPSTEPQS